MPRFSSRMFEDNNNLKEFVYKRKIELENSWRENTACQQKYKKSRATNFISVQEKPIYYLRFGKRSRLGQRHGLQSTTLTSYFYKNNY
jgi:hypothetical protein